MPHKSESSCVTPAVYTQRGFHPWLIDLYQTNNRCQNNGAWRPGRLIGCQRRLKVCRRSKIQGETKESTQSLSRLISEEHQHFPGVKESWEIYSFMRFQTWHVYIWLFSTWALDTGDRSMAAIPVKTCLYCQMYGLSLWFWALADSRRGEYIIAVYMKAIIDSQIANLGLLFPQNPTLIEYRSIFGTNLFIDFNSMTPCLASFFSGSSGSPYVSPKSHRFLHIPDLWRPKGKSCLFESGDLRVIEVWTLTCLKRVI